MTVAAIPDDRARADPRGSCIADEGQDLSNGQFAEAVQAVAAMFAQAGLGSGDVLAIMLPNRVELMTSMFAAWRLGAAVTPINPALTAHEARYQVDDAAPTLVIADEASAQKLRDNGRRIITVSEVTSPATPAVPPPCQRTPAHRRC